MLAVKPAIAIALIGLASIAGPAFVKAENTVPIPDNDVNENCKNNCSREHHNTASYCINQCLKTEQASYDHLRLMWPNLSRQTALECIRYAGGINGYYYYYRLEAFCSALRSREETLDELNRPAEPFRKW